MKCLKDPAFKEKLLKNPREAIESVINIKLPDEVQIKVLEDSEMTFHVVLPSSSELDAGNMQVDEISDADLKSLTGGASDAEVTEYINAIERYNKGKGPHPEDISMTVSD